MADYNINAVDRKVSYTGSAGVGPYGFSFEILVEDDIAVYFNETLLTKTTDYSVTINANGTGSVTLVVNVGGNVPTTPNANDLVVILGAKNIERTTDFVTAGDLRAAALNEQLDALTVFMQQIKEEVDRSVKAPAFDPTGISMTLPKKANRVNAFIAFDSNGDVSAAVPSDDVTTLAQVATDIKNLADIEDGTIATDAISNTAAIASNVTTVAGIAANVTTVAGNTSNINAVAADATDIGTVSTNIANVNTVAGISANVTAVAADATDIGTVATDLAGSNTIGTVAGVAANVTTVAGVASNVTTVAGISSDVTAVAGDATDIGTVSTNIANVNTVAGISGNVTTVAGISANVTSVAGNATNISTVAADGTDIGVVAGLSADIQTLADIQDGTVASTAISSLAALSTEIQALYAELASIAAKVSKTGDTMTGDLILNTTGALTLPVGTQAQRPTPAKGMFRFNDDEDQFEGYDGAAWGAVGGGNTAVVGWENQITVAESYTITTGNNMMSAGPVTIDTGYTVTVPTGSRWVVV